MNAPFRISDAVAARSPADSVAALRDHLWRAGFRPLALLTGDKRPHGSAWPERARRDPPEAAEATPHPEALNTGILCDGLRVLDVDCDDGGIVTRLRGLAVAMLGEAPMRWRENSPRVAMLYRAAEGEPAKRILSGTGGKVEVLGRGQQVLAFGRHPSGAALGWAPAAPGEVALGDLPAVTEDAVSAFLAEAAGIIGAEVKAAQPAPPAPRATAGYPPPAYADVASALAALPNRHDYDGWLRIGAAVFDALGDAGEGLFDAWSAKSAKYDADATRAKWRTFSTSPIHSVHAATLFHEARAAGWRPDKVTAASVAPQAVTAAAAPDRKRPLHRPLPPALPFPMVALGPLQNAAEAIQFATQAPAAICAQSVLGAATLAVQAHRDVMLPGGGQKPLTEIFASIAASGERKTTVDNLALRAVRKVEEEWRRVREGQVQDFANDLAAWKKARDTAMNKHKSDRAAIKAALDVIGPEPKPPPSAMLLVSDFSPEALVLHLKDSRPWAGIFTAEGGVLVGGHAFSDEKSMATAALLNTLWDGHPIRRTRVLTGTAFLPGRRCSAHLMMQAVVADKLLSDKVLDGTGLLARTLVVAPESTVGQRMFRETPAGSWATADYDARLTALLSRPLRTMADAPDILDPAVMELSPAARRLWIAFHDEAERQIGTGGDLQAIRAFGAKLAEHAGRLAAVLTVYADPDATEVTGEAMACGIALAQHYAGEMLRLHGGAAVAPDLQLAARLLEWWQSRPDPRVYLAAIYQRGLNAIGDAATARRAVTVLEEHGWVQRLPGGTVLDGAARADAWELVP